MEPERIARVIAEQRPLHRSTKPPGEHGQCAHCMIPGWPCDQSMILDLAAEATRYREALEELKATVQSVCEAGYVDLPGLEILGEALGESDEPVATTALETGAQR